MVLKISRNSVACGDQISERASTKPSVVIGNDQYERLSPFNYKNNFVVGKTMVPPRPDVSIFVFEDQNVDAFKLKSGFGEFSNG